MNKRSITLGALLLICSSFILPGISIAQTKGCCKSRYSAERREVLDIKKLGQEYTRLKHTHCEDCKSSMSDYYSIMQHLGEKLEGKTRQQIRKIMGSPDSRQDGKYIYFWRGWHDYLYFTFTSGKGRAEWYYAFE
jgi:hypothetical protein